MTEIIGYLEIDARVVVDKCEKVFKARAQEENVRKEKAIASRMHSGLKWFRPKTPEEAEKMILNEEMGFPPWSLGGYSWEEKTKTLYHVARQGDLPLLVDITLWNFILYWSNY